MTMSDSEIIHLTPGEWQDAARARLNALGLTYAELEAKAAARVMTTAETKVWMLIKDTMPAPAGLPATRDRLDRLDALLELRPGWLDGAGAAVDEDTIAALRALIADGFDEVRIYPTESGLIQMEWGDHELVVGTPGIVDRAAPDGEPPTAEQCEALLPVLRQALDDYGWDGAMVLERILDCARGSRELFSTWYRASTPEHEVWCESKSPREVARSVEGMRQGTFTLTRLRTYLVRGDWEQWDGEAS